MGKVIGIASVPTTPNDLAFTNAIPLLAVGARVRQVSVERVGAVVVPNHDVIVESLRCDLSVAM
jgi:hypothetical protein